MREHLQEIWKDLKVEGCEDRYSISTYARVYDKQNKKFVSQVLTGKPTYFYVNLQVNKDKRILRRVHNLLAKVFITNPKGYKVVDHKDNNRYNNSIDNLRWVTKKGNARNLKNQRKIYGKILIDFCKENNISDIQLYRIKQEHNLPNYEDAYEMYLSGDYSKTKYYYENLSKKDFMEKCGGISELKLQRLIQKGLSKEDILKGYTHSKNEALNSGRYNNTGIECENIWYPSLTYIGDRYNISAKTLSTKISSGEKVKQIIEDSKNKGVKHLYKGKEYTLRELEKISKEEYNTRIDYNTLKDRIYNKKWSVEKSVETPKMKSKYFSFKGEKRSKKYIFEYFNIKPKKANSMHCEGIYKDMSLSEFLSKKYNIENIEDYNIFPL